MPFLLMSQTASVVFSHPGGFYENSFNLELRCDGAYHIRYTTNGGSPTANSTLYEQPLFLDENLYSKSKIHTIVDCIPSAFYGTSGKGDSGRSVYRNRIRLHQRCRARCKRSHHQGGRLRINRPDACGAGSISDPCRERERNRRDKGKRVEHGHLRWTGNCSDCGSDQPRCPCPASLYPP